MLHGIILLLNSIGLGRWKKETASWRWTEMSWTSIYQHPAKQTIEISIKYLIWGNNLFVLMHTNNHKLLVQHKVDLKQTQKLPLEMSTHIKITKTNEKFQQYTGQPAQKYY